MSLVMAWNGLLIIILAKRLALADNLARMILMAFGFDFLIFLFKFSPHNFNRRDRASRPMNILYCCQSAALSRLTP